jgi:hypothetical protein
MEFYIRQGATDPILKLRLIDDGKNDKSSINDLLENADITFDMYEFNTENPILLNETCNITTRTKKFQNTTDEYYITHRFTTEHTSQVGRFEGKVTITFDNGNILILPVKEKLYINIF